MSGNVLEMLGYKPRVSRFEVAGFAPVHLIDLTLGEWSEALALPAEHQAARVAWLSLVNEAGERLYADESAIIGLPMPLVNAVVNESARLAGFKVSQADEATPVPAA